MQHRNADRYPDRRANSSTRSFLRTRRLRSSFAALRRPQSPSESSRLSVRFSPGIWAGWHTKTRPERTSMSLRIHWLPAAGSGPRKASPRSGIYTSISTPMGMRNLPLYGRRMRSRFRPQSYPHPPGKYQVLWRVESIPFEQQESLLKLLAITFGGDPACTDCNRVLRLPGFLNQKYTPAHRRNGRIPELIRPVAFRGLSACLSGAESRAYPAP